MRMMAARSMPPAAARPAPGIRRAYLHHLLKAEEMLGPMLLTWHNIQYYQDLMRGLRMAICEGGSSPCGGAGGRLGRGQGRAGEGR